jgi:hypothetical protein
MKIMKLNTSKSLKLTLLMAAVFMVAPAYAQNIGGMCTFINWVRLILGGAAVLAVLMLVLNSFFSKNSVFGDIIQTVLIGCIIGVGATTLISATGLVVTC